MREKVSEECVPVQSDEVVGCNQGIHGANGLISRIDSLYNEGGQVKLSDLARVSVFEWGWVTRRAALNHFYSELMYKSSVNVTQYFKFLADQGDNILDEMVVEDGK